MNVDNLEVRLAPRSPYEAQDLGLQLLRRHAGRVYGALLAVFLPIWTALLLLDLPTPAVSIFVIWWLKPLMDRIVLHVLSRAVFGDAPRVTQTLAALPSMLDRTLLTALSWRRLQLRRSLWFPIAALEGLRGRPLKERRAQLEYGDVGGAATTSTWLYLHIEAGLSLALLALASSFVPDGWLPSFQDFLRDEGAVLSTAFTWLSVLTWLPALFVVEALYLAAGFGLYLSRRTELEGWDIELGFERIATRLRSAAQRGIAVALACLCAFTTVPRAEAQTDDPDPLDVAREVLEHPDFDTQRTEEIWVPDFDFGGTGQPPAIGEFLAQLAQALGWVAIVVAVVWVLVLVARAAEANVGAKKTTRGPPPTEAFGLDLRPESLPTDVAGEARRLAEQGELVAALSLLYRGALARLVERSGLDILPGDTEQDCMSRVAESEPAPRARYFDALTGSWLRAAWGARLPELPDALALCDGWRREFDDSSTGTREEGRA